MLGGGWKGCRAGPVGQDTTLQVETQTELIFRWVELAWGAIMMDVADHLADNTETRMYVGIDLARESINGHWEAVKALEKGIKVQELLELDRQL